MTAKPTLDRIDVAILTALQKNARLSNKELAARVNLAPSSCLERVRRLRESGVLAGTHAEVDPAALGIEIQALVAVRLQAHSRDLVDAFQKHLTTLPEAIAFFHLAGENDFLIHVAVRDTEHLRTVILDAFTTRPEVAHLETALIFRHKNFHVLPEYLGLE